LDIFDSGEKNVKKILLDRLDDFSQLIKKMNATPEYKNWYT
jgi:hypothetical protein